MAAWKVSGTAFDATQSPPRCTIVTHVDLATSVYGLAVDGRGFMWTSSNPTKKIDTTTATVVDSVVNPSYYGIAIDGANRVWYGGWNGTGDLHRMDGDVPHAVLSTGAMGITAVTVHPDGTVWGSSFGGNPTGVIKLTLNAAGTAVTNTQYFADPEGLSTHGVAVDKAGKIWAAQVGYQNVGNGVGYVNRLNTDGTRDQRFPVDPGQCLYTYSDMTGLQLRTITTREGHWFQDFDSGYATPAWDHAEWTATVPAGTSLSVEFRAADTEAGFAGGTATAWCGPFTTSPASLTGCAQLVGHRWLQADVKLNTTTDGVRPSFSDLKVFWSH
jgi:streptogramin lyase